MQDEVEQFLKDNPDVETVDLIAADIPGNIFGKTYPVKDLSKVAADGTMIPKSTFVRGANGDFYDVLGYGTEDGDPDCAVHLVPGTLKRCPWSQTPKAQALVTGTHADNPNPTEARHVLRCVLDDLRADGLVPMVAFEYEFYLFDAARTASGSLTPAINPYSKVPDRAQMASIDRLVDFDAVLSDMVSAAKMQGMRTGVLSAELGPGQFELNLHHHGDALYAADEAVRFKHMVKQVAKGHGMLASFMAKPLPYEAGTGLHMHISMPDVSGKNVFGHDADHTDTLLHGIGGLMEMMPACMAVYAPNRNSFKRFRADNCATVSRSWGHENRTAAFRVPLCQPGQWRVEVRVPGADANPYLVLAAALVSIHHGIKNKLDPGPGVDSHINESDEDLPLDPHGALRALKVSDVFAAGFPDGFRDIYCAHRLAELEEFENHVGQRELDWYL